MGLLYRCIAVSTTRYLAGARLDGVSFSIAAGRDYYSISRGLREGGTHHLVSRSFPPDHAASLHSISGRFSKTPICRTSPLRPLSATATQTVALCTSNPTYVISFFPMQEALCRPSGTTLDMVHAERRAADHLANIGSRRCPWFS
jgi:hypothetical protein